MNDSPSIPTKDPELPLSNLRAAISKMHFAAFDAREHLPTDSDRQTLDLLRVPLEDLAHTLRDYPSCSYSGYAEVLLASWEVVMRNRRDDWEKLVANLITDTNAFLGPNKICRPAIVCLCGSTRFAEEFRAANLRETLAGRIVLSIGCDTKSDSDLLALGELTDEAKADLDELHKRKIDLADQVLILNCGGFIGDSTRSEVKYAIEHGKEVRWLNPPIPCPDCGGPPLDDWHGIDTCFCLWGGREPTIEEIEADSAHAEKIAKEENSESL